MKKFCSHSKCQNNESVIGSVVYFPTQRGSIIAKWHLLIESKIALASLVRSRVERRWTHSPMTW
jgi:hypothetical protein